MHRSHLKSYLRFVVFRLAAVLAVAVACAAVPGQALALDVNTITSPSGFNHCHWYPTIPYARTPSPGVVCTSTAGPESGHAVVLDVSGRRWAGYAAHRWIFGAGARLAYGRSISRWGITCSSSTSGLSCRDLGTGHGIYVSTTRHGLFSGAGGLVITGPRSGGAVESWDGRYAVRPSRFIYTGDGSGYLTITTWSSWTRSGATGTGYDHVDNCVPDCADGTFRVYPASFTFSNPVPCGGRLVFSVVRIDAIGEGSAGTRTYRPFLPNGC
jgi:hypothetical protein